MRENISLACSKLRYSETPLGRPDLMLDYEVEFEERFHNFPWMREWAKRRYAGRALVTTECILFERAEDAQDCYAYWREGGVSIAIWMAPAKNTLDTKTNRV